MPGCVVAWRGLSREYGAVGPVLHSEFKWIQLPRFTPAAEPEFIKLFAAWSSQFVACASTRAGELAL